MNFFEFQEKLAHQRKSAGSKPDSVGGDNSAAGSLSVSELTGQIDRVLKSHLPVSFLVRGEVSNYKLHGSSGHAYFTLKDAAACINCVMWKSEAANVKFKPTDGMELLATGRVAVYAQQGKYQLYVTRLQPLGQGALELAFQQLRAKLEAEGLFALERKKPIPPYPARIALVTSRHTAALQDMLKVLQRFPWVRLFIYDVPVQGDGAAQKIAAALAHLNARHMELGGIDLVLLGRGGGSLEDLWEFNEEVVARAVAQSLIPVITGVGHEVDVSIADLVADYHAHTPTEAAQVAVQHWRAARDNLGISGLRLRRGVRGLVQQARQRLTAIERNECFRRPLDRVNGLRQLLDDRQRALALVMGEKLRGMHRRVNHAAERLDRHRPASVISRIRQRLGDAEMALARGMANRCATAQQKVFALILRLRERHPRHLIGLNGLRVQTADSRLQKAIRQDQRRRGARLEALEARLRALDPQRVLERGYSITTLKKTGVAVRRAADLAPGDRLVTRFAEGTAESVVQDARQMSLFE